MKFTLRGLALSSFSIIILVLAALSIKEALPPQVLVIETGPVGGSYHDNAVLYSKHLEAAGLKVQVRPNPQSLQTIDRLQADVPRTDPAHIDVGFTVQPLNAEKYPNVLSAGVVQMQPLFTFYNRQLGQIRSPADLKGKRVVMPPQGSASAQAATAVMALYGVDEKNSRFSYLPITQAAQELKNGMHDAGFFMLASSNALVRDLVMTPALAMMPIREARGVTRHLDHLRHTALPFGAFDMPKLLPEQDIDMVAGTVNVMVRKDINPAVLYTLLQAMKETHGGQTLVSVKGEFPTTIGTALRAHPLAVQWEKSGTPWMYSNFSPTLASLIDKYWFLLMVIVFVANFYSVCLYLYELYETTVNFLAVRILKRHHDRLLAGKTSNFLGERMFVLAEAIAKRESNEHKAHELLDKVRKVHNEDTPTALP
jgi:TRAP transporter TAXI family solute receptor